MTLVHQKTSVVKRWKYQSRTLVWILRTEKVSSLVLGDKEAAWVEWVSVDVEAPLLSLKKVERGEQEKEAHSGETS